MQKKIKTQNEIPEIAQKLRSENKKIVTYNGSFDLLHIGHIKSIQQAKSLGDILILLVNSDSSVKLYKGASRPIIPLSERMEALAALEAVDLVTSFEEINPKVVLEKIKPDIHCNGSDWGEDCLEREVVEKNGGKIHVLKWEQGYSTTDLISKIVSISKKPTPKAIFLDRDGTINLNKDGYVHTIEDFEFTPGSLDALRKLSKTNYKIIIVGNQSGVGRGYFPLEELEKLNEWMLKTLKTEGVRIDATFYCIHKPDDNCDCRKPKPGLLFDAVKKFDISLNGSWIVGDKESDIILGRETNTKTIKLGEKMQKELKLEPNFYVKDLSEAIDIILQKEK